jgi:hypothetical protein
MPGSDCLSAFEYIVPGMPQNPHARPSLGFSRRAPTKPGRANLIKILQVVFAEARDVPGGA